MTEIAFAMPIVRGKEDLYRETWDELTGPRRDEFAAAQKDAGITRQAVWRQQMPDSRTLAVVYIEATDPEAPGRFASSDTDISRWFMERMEEVYGRDFTRPPLQVELDHDFRV
jgi:hypothetical protein